MMFRTTQPLATRSACGLRIDGLRKRFGRTPVLNGIDLDVAPGELVTVLGPSGSGKTTLLRLLCGFERADGGRIELGGRTVADGRALHLPPERRGIGYVAQEGALFPHLSVAENVLFGLRGLARKEREPRVADLLQLVDLAPGYATRRPAALSGGEQQRVALARALAPSPAIVLLDEPFSALDAGLRAGLRRAIATSLKRVHATALLVTHDQDEALSMGDRVAVLQGGRLAQVATPQTLYRLPANRALARFVGAAVLVPGIADAGAVTCGFGRLPLAAPAAGVSGAVEVMIRPEQFCVGAVGGDVAYTACVEDIVFHGHDAQLTLRLPDGVAITATVPGFDLPEPGQTVAVAVRGHVVAYPADAAES